MNKSIKALSVVAAAALLSLNATAQTSGTVNLAVQISTSIALTVNTSSVSITAQSPVAALAGIGTTATDVLSVASNVNYEITVKAASSVLTAATNSSTIPVSDINTAPAQLGAGAGTGAGVVLSTADQAVVTLASPTMARSYSMNYYYQDKAANLQFLAPESYSVGVVYTISSI